MPDFSEYGDAKRVFYFFEEISKIPRGSGNTEKIADYIEAFAKERKLFYRRDGANNVVIKKIGSCGRENEAPVILQGHTDMVIATEDSVKRDMESEGLMLYIDGEYLRAKGTTLGADDGIAVAYMLALLDSNDISNPPLEAVFTSDEEIGLIGAGALDTSILCGRTMINLDSDEEGVFIAGCAGGRRVDVSVSAEAKANPYAYKLSVLGLSGGHSGMEIANGRENAIKILGELIPEGARIGQISGGNADNAIPRYAECLIYPKGDIEKRIEMAFLKYLKNEPGLEIKCEKCENGAALFSDADSKKVKEIICRADSGVIAMNKDIPTLVDTSQNLGVIRTRERSVDISFSVRSSSENEKEAAVTKLSAIAREYGASLSQHGDYPGWEYKSKSRIREIFSSAYERLFGKKPQTLIIHAGLECGIFCGKIAGLDCISLGPKNLDIHTTEERLSIPSAVRYWELVKQALKNI